MEPNGVPNNFEKRPKLPEAEHRQVLLDELRRRETPENYLNSIWLDNRDGLQAELERQNDILAMWGAITFPIEEQWSVEVQPLPPTSEQQEKPKTKQEGLIKAWINPEEYARDLEETESWDGYNSLSFDEIQKRQQAEQAFKDRLDWVWLPIAPEKQIEAVSDSIWRDFSPILEIVDNNLNGMPLKPEIKENIRVNILNKVLRDKDITDILYSVLWWFIRTIKKWWNAKVPVNPEQYYPERIKYLEKRVNELTQDYLANNIQQPIAWINQEALLNLRESLEEYDIKLLAWDKILNSTIEASSTTLKTETEWGQTIPSNNPTNSDNFKDFQTLAVESPWFVKILLKIPLLGNFIWAVLKLSWSNKEERIKDFDNRIENHKILWKLKWLWKQVEKDWKVTKSWTEPFTDVDFSKVTSRELKDELNKVKSIATNADENFWKKAFSEWWYQEEGKPALKFGLLVDWKITNGKLSGEITTDNLKAILEVWLKEYDEKVVQQAEEVKAQPEREQIENAEIRKLALEILNWKWEEIFKKYDNSGDFARALDNDYKDFKNIRLSDLKEVYGNVWSIGNLFHQKLWSEYTKFEPDLQNALIKAVDIISKWNNIRGTAIEATIWDIMENKDFKEDYISGELTKINAILTPATPTSAPTV